MASRKPLVVAFKAEISKAVSQVKAFGREISTVAGQVGKAERGIKGLADKSEAEAKQAGAAFRGLRVTTEADADRIIGSHQEMLSGLKRLRDENKITAGEFARAWKTTEARIASINAKIARDTRTMAMKVKDSLKSVGAGATQIGARASVAVSAPMAIGLGAAVRAAADLEQTMGAVRAVAGNLSDNEFEELKKKARELGVATKFSATESADAIRVLAANGLSARDILDGAIDASIRTSAATGADLALVADLITDVRAQFKLTAGELPGIADQIVGAMSNSKFAAEDYAHAFGQAGAVAGSAGVELQDFVAAIAATSSGFTSGSDAGTSFKTFVQRLVPTSKPAVEAVAEIGFSAYTASGRLKSMAEIAESLKRSLNGLSEKKRNQVLTDIFGSDAIRTANLLADAGGDGIDAIMAKVGQGDAAKAAEMRMAGFNGELAKLRSALEGFGIALAESGLISTLTALVQKGTEWVSSLSESSPKLLKWLSIFGVIGSVLGPVLLVIGQAAIGLRVLMFAFSGFGGTLLRIGKFLLGIGGGLSRIVAIGRILVVAIGAVVGSVGAIPLAIGAAIAAAGVLIYSYWDEIKGFVTETVPAFFSSMIDGISHAVSSGFDWLLDQARTAFDKVTAWMPDWLKNGTGISLSVAGGPLAMGVGAAAAIKSAVPATAGTPVNLVLDGQSYETYAAPDVAAALTKNQSLKRSVRPTNPSRAFR